MMQTMTERDTRALARGNEAAARLGVELPPGNAGGAAALMMGLEDGADPLSALQRYIGSVGVSIAMPDLPPDATGVERWGKKLCQRYGAATGMLLATLRALEESQRTVARLRAMGGER